MNYSNPKTVESEPSAPIVLPLLKSDQVIEEAWPLRNNSWGKRNGRPRVKRTKGGGIYFLMKVNRRSNEGFIASPVGTSPSSFLKAGNESI